MATRRIPLIPPPPLPALPGERRDSESNASTSHGTAAKPLADDAHTKPLPTTYRGKSSGEFERVVNSYRGDTNSLIAEAEQWILKLTNDDNYRRLLQLAVLRRDSALLSGLLEVVRHRKR